MAQISIFHNVNRDASFGLNTVFRTSDEKPEDVERALEMSDGRWTWKAEAIDTAERHELVWVFVYSSDPMGHDDQALLNEAWNLFNVGVGPVSDEYRGLKLRSLSKGDVVGIDGRFYSCESVGWKLRTRSELRLLPAAQAEGVIRARYQMTPKEELTVTVPLPD